MREYDGVSLSGLDLCSSVWLGHVEAIDPSGVIDASADFQVACPNVSDRTDESGLQPCADGVCSCPAGFACSSSDTRTCSTEGRCRALNALAVTVSANPLSPMVDENVIFSSVVSG